MYASGTDIGPMRRVREVEKDVCRRVVFGRSSMADWCPRGVEVGGESASWAQGGLEGCSQAQVGLVWSGLCLGTGCKGGRVPTSVG